MASIGRLFAEVGAKVTMREDLVPAMQALDQLGLKAFGAGKQLIAAFNDTINPTKKLEQELALLFAAGKSQEQVWAVYKDKLLAAAEQTTRMGQAVDPTVAAVIKFGKETETTGGAFEGLGTKITEFVRNPVAAVQTGFTSMLTKMGPMAVGIAGVGTAFVAAGVGLFKFVSGAADALERLDNLSAMTGIAVDDLKAYEQIASNAGLAGLDLGRSIAALNKELGSPAGAEFEKNLKALGISTVDATGHTKDAVTILDELRTVLLSIEDPAERSQVAIAVLGTRQRELIPLLLNSEKGLRDNATEVKAMGLAYDEVTKKNLRDFDNMMDKISTWWEVGKVKAQSWAAGLANAMSYGVKSILGMTDAVKANDTAVTDLVEGPMPDYVKLMADAAKKTEEHEKAVKKLPETYRGWGITVEAASGRLEAMQYELDRVNKALKEMDRLTKLVASEGMADLDREIKESNSGLEAFGTKARGAGEEWKAMGLDLSVSYNPALHEATEKSKTFADVMKNQVSTIFTDLSSKIAGNILEWKGWGETIIGTLKAFAEAALRTLIESLMTPLTGLLNNIMSAIGGLFTGKGTAGFSTSSLFGGIFSGLGGLFGAGAIPATAVDIGATVGSGTLVTAGGAGGAGVLAGLGSSLSSAGSAIWSTMMTTMAGIPIAGWIAAGAAGLTYLFTKLFTKDTFEAGAIEVARDLGGIAIGEKAVESFFSSLGLTGKGAEGIRKDLLTSPKFLTEVAGPLALAQGKMDEFLTSLENVQTVMGTVDLRKPFEEFLKSGDATALNKAWTDLFSQSKALVAIMPDFATKLAAVGTVAEDVSESTGKAADAADRAATSLETLGARSEEAGKKMVGGMRDFADQVDEAGERMTRVTEGGVHGTSLITEAWNRASDAVKNYISLLDNANRAFQDMADQRAEGYGAGNSNIVFGGIMQSTRTREPLVVREPDSIRGWSGAPISINLHVDGREITNVVIDRVSTNRDGAATRLQTGLGVRTP